MRRLSRTLEAFEQRLVLDNTVVFNELMYHPADDPEGTLEWIELHNQLAVDMDVSDWSLDGGIDFTFPDGTIVPGKGYLVVAADPAALEAASGFDGSLGPFTGRLSNGGEELRLFNNDSRLMNTLDYRDGGNWPVGPDGSGATLAKRFSDDASELTGSWVTSLEVGGTPGAFNFEPDSENPDLMFILDEAAPARALVPSNGSLGLSWIEPAFDDSAWISGDTGVGYDENSDYLPLIGLNS